MLWLGDLWLRPTCAPVRAGKEQHMGSRDLKCARGDYGARKC